MYFPTLVEVPIAKMFLGLGMHRGPLLAYLMADPELSLQSILMISVIIGRLKAWTYVAWVALFSTLAGLIYGAWVDGTPLGLLALYLGALVAVLAAALWLVRSPRSTGGNRRGHPLGGCRMEPNTRKEQHNAYDQDPGLGLPELQAAGASWPTGGCSNWALRPSSSRSRTTPRS